jgi:alkyl sulfatase BDS1-like metallo-beta-lactamase superfamily hydrolase
MFTGEGNPTVGLHVRRGIAEYLPVPADHYREADFVMELDGETWSKLYLNEIGVVEAIDSQSIKLAQGDREELVAIFAMFDRYQPARNIKIPSPDDITHR